MLPVVGFFLVLTLALPGLARAGQESGAAQFARQGQAQSGQAAQQGVAHEGTGVIIRVLPGDWGTAEVGDITRVLELVAQTLAPAFPRHAGDTIEVAYSTAGPHALFERRPDGAYRIYLAVQDTRWDQLTYQFAHEYCHVVSNVEQRLHQDAALRGTQWFEEAMCEAVSLLALERVAVRWEQAPPQPGWGGYAPAFLAYERQLTGQAHRKLPAGSAPDKPLEHWYAANRAALQYDPYQRGKNELVASALHAWLASSPQALEAIGYLGVAGLRENGGQAQFGAYLERWRQSSPERLRDTVTRVSALFGLDAPRAQLAAR
jgi:hypothetical protein